MAKYTEREYRVGEYWLSQRKGSTAWYRTWYEAKQTRRKSLGTTDFQQAKQALDEWFIQNVRHQNAAPEEIQMATVLVNYWEDHAKNTASYDTIKTHCRYWSEYAGGRTVSEVTSYAAQAEFKERLKKMGLGAASINHVLSVGKAAIRHAWQRGEIASIPPFIMEKIGSQEPKGRPLSFDEIKKVYAECAPHVQMLILWLIGTASRPISIYELTWDMVDLENGLIALNPAGRVQNKKHRPVVRLPAALEGITEREKEKLDVPYTDKREIEHKRCRNVVTVNNKPVASVKTSWRKSREAAGLDQDVTLYSFRHTMGRYLRSNSVPMDEVKTQLGHRAFGVTERYTAFAPEYLENAVRVIDEMLHELALKPPA